MRKDIKKTISELEANIKNLRRSLAKAFAQKDMKVEVAEAMTESIMGLVDLLVALNKSLEIEREHLKKRVDAYDEIETMEDLAKVKNIREFFNYEN